MLSKHQPEVEDSMKRWTLLRTLSLFSILVLIGAGLLFQSWTPDASPVHGKQLSARAKESEKGSETWQELCVSKLTNELAALKQTNKIGRHVKIFGSVDKLKLNGEEETAMRLIGSPFGTVTMWALDDNTIISATPRDCDLTGVYLPNHEETKRIHAEMKQLQIGSDFNMVGLFAGILTTSSAQSGSTCTYKHYEKCTKKGATCLHLNSATGVASCPNGWSKSEEYSCGCGGKSCDIHKPCSHYSGRSTICTVSQNPCNYDPGLAGKIVKSSEEMERIQLGLKAGQAVAGLIPFPGAALAGVAMSIVDEAISASASNTNYDALFLDLDESIKNVQKCFGVKADHSEQNSLKVKVLDLKSGIAPTRLEYYSDPSRKTGLDEIVSKDAEEDCVHVKNWFKVSASDKEFNKLLLSGGLQALESCMMRYTIAIAWDPTTTGLNYFSPIYAGVAKQVTKTLYQTVHQLRQEYFSYNGCFYPDDAREALAKLYVTYDTILRPAWTTASPLMGNAESFPTLNGFTCRHLKGREFGGGAARWFREYSHAACETRCLNDRSCDCYVWRLGRDCYLKASCDPDESKSGYIGGNEYSGLCGARTSRCDVIRGKEFGSAGQVGVLHHIPDARQCEFHCMNDENCECFAFRNGDCYKKRSCNTDFTAAVPIGGRDYSGICLKGKRLYKCEMIPNYEPHGHWISTVSRPSLADCMDTCVANSQCSCYVYTGWDKACYLKSNCNWNMGVSPGRFGGICP